MIKTIIKVNGMMCGNCEAHVSHAIREHFDTKKVRASKSKKEVEVISNEALEVSKVEEVINETGYEYVSCESSPYQKKGLFIF